MERKAVTIQVRQTRKGKCLWFISAVWTRHEKSPEVDKRGCGTLRYTLSQKHQSTYPHNTQTTGINDPTSSISVPLSMSVSLLSSLITSYMHKHRTRVWREVGLYMWNSNSTVRMRIVTLSSRSATSRGAPTIQARLICLFFFLMTLSVARLQHWMIWIFMNYESERTWKEMVVILSRHFFRSDWENPPCQDGRSQSRDTNSEPLESEAGTTGSRRSVKISFKANSTVNHRHANRELSCLLSITLKITSK
jgi:hypothetical protein